MTDIEITEFAFTFGTQYRRPSEFNHPDENHPRGMHGNGYAVIEAPDMGTARAIAHAIFGDKWAFPYTLEEILSDPRRQQFYPDGEILRIAWQTPKQVQDILGQMQSLIEGHPAEAVQIIANLAVDEKSEPEPSSERMERDSYGLAEHGEQIRQRFAAMGSPRAIRDGKDLEEKAAGPDGLGEPVVDIYSEQSVLSHRPSAAELLAEREEPFLWDGKGSMHILAVHAHVHDADSPGTCLKNRFGPLCTPLVQSEVPETGDFRDGTEAEDTGGY